MPGKITKISSMRKLSLSQGGTIQIGRILHDMFTRDKADFAAFSTRYADPFADDFLKIIDEGAELPSVRSLIAEQKVVTKRLHLNMKAFRADFARIAALIGLTKEPLTIANRDFGIKSVRNTLPGYKVAEFVASFNNLLKNMKANLAPLEAAGMPNNYVKELETRAKMVSDDDVLQRKIISRRAQLVQDNATHIGLIHDKMRQVLESGKALYKTTNKAKVKDYTLTELRRKHKAAQTTAEPAKV